MNPVSSWLVGGLFLLLSSSVFAQLDFQSIQSAEELRRGVRAFHNGFFNAALVSIKKALAYNPDDDLARRWLGRAYFQAGYEDSALAEWRVVLSGDRAPAVLNQFVETIESRRRPPVGGKPDENWVTAGELGGQAGENQLFLRPSSVRTRHDGSNYVVSYATNEVLVLDANGVIRRRFRGGFAGLDHPFDVAEASDGSFYVSEFRGDRITKFTENGDRVAVLGRRGRGDGELFGPQFLATDADDNVYVSDWGNRRVTKYGPDGRFLLSFGERSAFHPGLVEPTGLAYSRGQVYVADAGRKHLAIFDRHGNFQTTALERRLFRPEGLRAQADGSILICDANRVLRFDPELETLVELADLGGTGTRITAADIDVNGTLVAADFDGNRIRFLSNVTGMYAGLDVVINRVTSDDHPEVLVDVTVRERNGNPVVGLDPSNFTVTENNFPVGQLEMAFSTSMNSVVDLAVVAEQSLEARALRPTLQRAVRELATGVSRFGRLRVITAGAVPAVAAKSQDGLAAMVRAVAEEGKFSASWSFDLACRLAVSDLIPERSRKAIVFLSSGQLPDRAFSSVGLIETLAYMRNNSVAFYVVYVGGRGSVDELEYLARESGGASFAYESARGILDLPRMLSRQRAGTYILRFKSPSDTDFGRRYLPLEVQAAVIKRTGRDELGYFAPLVFTRN